MVKYRAVNRPIPVTDVASRTVVFSLSSESTRASISPSMRWISSLRHLVVFLMCLWTSFPSSGSKVFSSLGCLPRSALNLTSWSLTLSRALTFSRISGNGLYSSISLWFLAAYRAIRMASSLSFLPRCIPRLRMILNDISTQKLACFSNSLAINSLPYMPVCSRQIRVLSKGMPLFLSSLMNALVPFCELSNTNEVVSSPSIMAMSKDFLDMSTPTKYLKSDFSMIKKFKK